MPRIEQTRKAMIRSLVAHSVERALAEAQGDAETYWLHEIFEKGFVGYARFSERELRLEMQLRGLDQAAEHDAPDEDDEGDIDGDEDFRFNLASS